jgi:hypothetical protein
MGKYMAQKPWLTEVEEAVPVVAMDEELKSEGPEKEVEEVKEVEAVSS